MRRGTVLLAVEPPLEPPERFRKAADEQGYGPEDSWNMRVGETRTLSGAWPSNA